MTTTAIRLPVTTRENVLTNDSTLLVDVATVLRRSGYRVAIASDVPFTLYVSWKDALHPAKRPTCVNV